MRDFNDVSAQRIFRKQTDEGYLVVIANISGFQPNHPSGYFSLTYDLYTTERAYRSGNENASFSGGSSDEEIAKIAELRPFVDLHLADADSGEPMHGKANAWWYFKAAFNLPDGWTVGQYDRIPEGKTESAEAFSRMCRVLRVAESDFPGLAIEGRANEIAAELDATCEPEDIGRNGVQAFSTAFGEYVNNDCRPRWQAEAAAFRNFLAAEPELPKPHVNREVFTVTLDGDDGTLKVSATLQDESHRDDIGDHHVYKVKITGPGTPKTYSESFYGSAKDYEDGKIEAADAAWGILRHLLDAYWDEDGEMKDMMREHSGAVGVRSYNRAVAFGEAYWRTLEGNRDLIGR